MKPSSLIGFTLVLIFNVPVQVEGTLILGVDENPDGRVPLVDRPTSTESKDRFLARLRPNQFGLQDFESVGLGVPVLGDNISFTPDVATAQLSGYVQYVEVTNTATFANDGVYATSGDHYLYTTTEADTPYFSLSFSTPVSALGFDAIDANDDSDPAFEVPGKIGLLLELTHPDGRVTEVFDEPGLGMLPDGSVAFIGIWSPNDPFVGVDFQWESSFGDEGMGIDDLYVGLAVPEPSYPGIVMVVIGFFVTRNISSRR